MGAPGDGCPCGFGRSGGGLEAGHHLASRRARRAGEKRRELAVTGAAGPAIEAKLESLQKQQRAWSAGAEGAAA